MAAKKKIAKKKATTARKKAVTKRSTKKATKKKATTARKKAAAKRSTKKAAKKKVTTARKKAAAKQSTKKTTKKKATTARKKAAAKHSTKKATIARKKVRKFMPNRGKIGEDYMNPSQAEHFRQLLIDWKRTLMEEVDRTVHHMQDEASHFPDPNDRATQEEEFALELRTRDRERKLIKKIDEAMLSLDLGEYGYCETCGIEIGAKRLEARPTATLCIDCKTLAEIKERQLGQDR